MFTSANGINPPKSSQDTIGTKRLFFLILFLGHPLTHRSEDGSKPLKRWKERQFRWFLLEIFLGSTFLRYSWDYNSWDILLLSLFSWDLRYCWVLLYHKIAIGHLHATLNM